MWSRRLIDGQGTNLDRYTWSGRHEAPKLQVDELRMGDDSDEEESRARRKQPDLDVKRVYQKKLF